MIDDDQLRELYQEIIFDHNRSPRNFGEIDPITHSADGHNPLCGDQLTVFLNIENDVVVDVSFKGQGCAISTASASLMTEAIKGQPVTKVEELFKGIHQMLTDKHPDDVDFGKLEVLSGVREFPTRVKCASLAWHTLDNAINMAEDIAKTE